MHSCIAFGANMRLSCLQLSTHYVKEQDILCQHFSLLLPEVLEGVHDECVMSQIGTL